MTCLSDRSIRALCFPNPFKHVQSPLLIEPYYPENVQPCSYDLTLEGNIVLPPLKFVLLSTREKVNLPANLQGQIYGRSSIGRVGVFVHISAGFVDAGFSGTLTLECFNASEKTWRASHGDRIAQIAFYYLDHGADVPYHGRYQFQEGVTPSRS